MNARVGATSVALVREAEASPTHDHSLSYFLSSLKRYSKKRTDAKEKNKKAFEKTFSKASKYERREKWRKGIGGRLTSFFHLVKGGKLLEGSFKLRRIRSQLTWLLIINDLSSFHGKSQGDHGP